VIYAGTQGYLDKVPVARVREWEAGFIRFLKSEQKDLLAAIEKQKALDDGLFDKLKAAISTFNTQFGVEGAKSTPDAGAKAAAAAKPGDKAQPKAQAPAAKTEAVAPAAAAPAAKAEAASPAPAAPVAKAEAAAPAAAAPAAKAEAASPAPAAPVAKAEATAPGAPAAKAEAKAAAPAKVEKAQLSPKAETEDRPSQLNQIRAALADTPAEGEPKPKRPRKPKAP